MASGLNQQKKMFSMCFILSRCSFFSPNQIKKKKGQHENEHANGNYIPQNRLPVLRVFNGRNQLGPIKRRCATQNSVKKKNKRKNGTETTNPFCRPQRKFVFELVEMGLRIKKLGTPR